MENHDNLLCHFYRGLGQINHNIKLKRNDEIKKKTIITGIQFSFTVSLNILLCDISFFGGFFVLKILSIKA